MAKTNLSADKHPFLHSVQEIKRRAREHLHRGPVTQTLQTDLAAVLKLLDEALATEVVCVLRYRAHYFNASSLGEKVIAEEFLEHSKKEQEHLDEIAERIQQLGGQVDLDPAAIAARTVTEYQSGESIQEMVEEDLIAERIVIDTYRDMIRYLGDGDPTTRRLMEHILAEEEEHADELAAFLVLLGSRGSSTNARVLAPKAVR